MIRLDPDRKPVMTGMTNVCILHSTNTCGRSLIQNPDRRPSSFRYPTTTSITLARYCSSNQICRTHGQLSVECAAKRNVHALQTWIRQTRADARYHTWRRTCAWNPRARPFFYMQWSMTPFVIPSPFFLLVFDCYLQCLLRTSTVPFIYLQVQIQSRENNKQFRQRVEATVCGCSFTSQHLNFAFVFMWVYWVYFSICEGV
jgi:hypothetical protein